MSSPKRNLESNNSLRSSLESGALSEGRQTAGILQSLARRLSTWGPLLAVFVLWLLFSIISPRFATLDSLQNIASRAAIPLVLSVGLTFVILLGAIDLSLEGVMQVCSLSVALLVLNDRNTMQLGWIAVLLAVALGASFGLFNGWVHTFFRIPSFMVTLGTWAITAGLAMLLSGGHPPIIEDQNMRAWGLGQWFGFSQLTFVAVGCVAIGYILQRFTRFGRYAYVIGGNEENAVQAGINVSYHKVLVFIFCGAMAGLAGVMESARLGLGHSLIGTGALFTTITAVVIGGTLLSGGRGGVLNSAVGVLLITVLANGMIFAGVSSYVQQAVHGLIILIAVVATSWHLRHRLRVIK